jgi:peroxin-2
LFADDVKAASDDGEGDEQEGEEGEGGYGEDSHVMVEEDPDRSLDDLRAQTPSVASDQADDSEGSESEDYEAEEDELGHDLDG